MRLKVVLRDSQEIGGAPVVTSFFSSDKSAEEIPVRALQEFCYTTFRIPIACLKLVSYSGSVICHGTSSSFSTLADAGVGHQDRITVLRVPFQADPIAPTTQDLCGQPVRLTRRSIPGPNGNIQTVTEDVMTKPSIPLEPALIYLPDSASQNEARLKRHVTPPDQNSLFKSLSELLFNGEVPTSKMRWLCASSLSNRPTVFTAEVLKCSNGDYGKKLLNPESWGGYIELSAIALEYNIALAVWDVGRNHLDVYGKEYESRKGRYYLLCDEFHYDWVTLVTDKGEHKLFAANDNKVLDRVKELATRDEVPLTSINPQAAYGRPTAMLSPQRSSHRPAEPVVQSTTKSHPAPKNHPAAVSHPAPVSQPVPIPQPAPVSQPAPASQTTSSKPVRQARPQADRAHTPPRHEIQTAAITLPARLKAPRSQLTSQGAPSGTQQPQRIDASEPVRTPSPIASTVPPQSQRQSSPDLRPQVRAPTSIPSPRSVGRPLLSPPTIQSRPGPWSNDALDLSTRKVISTRIPQRHELVPPEALAAAKAQGRKVTGDPSLNMRGPSYIRSPPDSRPRITQAPVSIQRQHIYTPPVGSSPTMRPAGGVPGVRSAPQISGSMRPTSTTTTWLPNPVHISKASLPAKPADAFLHDVNMSVMGPNVSPPRP